MGNGSNLLVGDKGFRGVIIQMFKQMSKVYAEGDRVYAQAGALLSKHGGDGSVKRLLQGWNLHQVFREHLAALFA